MNRRQFLTRALASVPVIVAGEQLLELLAPKRTIFLPPRGGWMGMDLASGTDSTAWLVGDGAGGYYAFVHPSNMPALHAIVRECPPVRTGEIGRYQGVRIFAL